MIQRKQSIFLILSLLSFVLLFISPFASFKLGTEVTCNISILSIGNLEGFTKVNYMFIIMQALTTLFMSLVILTIFMYKKRALQTRLCAFILLTNVFLIGAMFITINLTLSALNLPKGTPITYLFPVYIPLITLLFVRLAQRAIRKDAALIRSLNRLR
ncbi:MAG: DUF4293 domain-containing protein [Bacteroidales bacterium]|nr:DUF4293 domain-containing protein [Bacteroidales bacterium]